MPVEKIVELGPHTKMSAEEALAVSSREEWEDVIVVGFHKGDDSLTVRSSNMKCQLALWIAEHLRLHALDRL